jgi:hypothetical protein
MKKLCAFVISTHDVMVPLDNSRSRPSGNVTGFSTMELSIAGKWLQLLKEIAPSVERATFMLFHPARLRWPAAWRKADDPPRWLRPSRQRLMLWVMFGVGEHRT